LISLGCPKNLVDSEVMMGLLDHAGARLTSHPEEAEILIVNARKLAGGKPRPSISPVHQARPGSPHRVAR
jgi:ribosomal protein S12 methylthiotransferase